MSEDNTDELEFEYDGPSKSQVKRDMQHLRDMGEQLLALPESPLEELLPANIFDAVRECRKITKGNARKRQIQYIGKLLRQVDTRQIQAVLDRFDASSSSHTQQFHQLERWRERLIEGDDTAMAEILAVIPDIDRQHLRQLTRKAIAERAREGVPPVEYRKLFQYLKSFESDNPIQP